jgi:predicted metalloprotease
MRWQRRGPSEDLEDRRAEGGGRIPLPIGRGGLSVGGAVAMLAVAWLLGINPLDLLGGGVGTNVGIDPGAPAGDFSASPEEEELVQFVSFVLDDLQDTWSQLLPGYRRAHLVLFREATHSACGTGQSEMGPFYCPADQKVYIDLSFYGDLRSRFGAPGDFAQAYVIAHEIGHHVQALTGVEQRVRAEQREAGRSANTLSVRMELQADCLAGVWGHHAARRDVLETGDVEEGLRAAAAIGDDRIQSMSGRGVQPESFTHGSSDQRVAWLRRGLESGNPEVCDTFRAKGEE